MNRDLSELRPIQIVNHPNREPSDRFLLISSNKIADFLPSEPLDTSHCKPEESNQIGPQAGEQSQAISIDFHQLLKSFVQERKKMWQSILDYIEKIESEEAELERILEQEQEDASMADATFNVQFTDEEDGAMNRTFTKVDLEISADCENSMEFNASYLMEPADTPIPKKKPQLDKKKKKRRRRSLLPRAVETMPIVFELEEP